MLWIKIYVKNYIPIFYCVGNNLKLNFASDYGILNLIKF